MFQPGYSAAHYDINNLENFDQPLMELGRVCMVSSLRDLDILRLVWAYSGITLKEEKLDSYLVVLHLRRLIMENI